MGTTFEEQQAAREEYQAKVRAQKGKPVNLTPSTYAANGVVEEGETVGEAQDSRKDETTAEQIQESGEAMGAPREEDESDAEPVEADASAEEADSEPVEASEDDSDDEKPNVSDKKAVWVAYVAELTGESEEDINERHTKDELVEKYG